MFFPKNQCAKPNGLKIKPIRVLHEKWLKNPNDRVQLKQRWMDNARLAYVDEVPVWWCEELGTVLANEEVVDGKSEVGGFPVVRKPMRQWMLRITAYAEKLLARS